MNITDFRLKFRRFLRKNVKIISIAFILWAIIFTINLIMKYRKVEPEMETNYEPHVSVMDTDSDVPSNIAKDIEEMIEKYIGFCNDGAYYAAFNMLTEECREHEFNNNIEDFMQHVLTKMPTPKKYSIQNYSNMLVDTTKVYIYSIKYYDDYLATGLTNSEYSYTLEKLTFYRENAELKMCAGNFIYQRDVKKITENEYLKIDVLAKTVNYSIETYEVKFTNRSDYTVVVSDEFEINEVLLQLPQETRQRVDTTNKIILMPKESKTLVFSFTKFVDDGDESQALLFPNVRVLENYSGPDAEEHILQAEIDNAIAKMSMDVVL